ncbi:GntR family transcriptional regulator [Tetragenococcus koreensis]|uniref:GntR family transcriptional regulator n=1 Tax=Tetragenococcus koreensis TaxID=290335 RepID=A0AAN4ZSF7_9ENTE|nr:GntR family transcriptional regulator [Tetragenococcus koreensis]MDN6664619.1 GntR family transcriptional regulator [Tetragenococcus koreensis]GEQ49597.1 GntR family transcriptional regulator [Tetragenococcus koreensis]GEQ52043.1 GntR family transcriptional regulator [Tetragenococcus koreensis]GEQ54578.1 GntR family transcriptional regulator [Tetragenococcus koreensis]GEQ57045.1 GntR family transcriptional regulator [Tetragenococcus koreensis]
MSIKDRVYSFLSEELTKGRLERGNHITEQYLVDNLGLSRTPIREALFQLVAEDILEKEPRKGYKFKSYTADDIKNLYELIGVLDGKVAADVLDKLTEEDYALMRFLIDSMYSAIKNGLYTKYNELQMQFHNVYINKSSNNFITEELVNKKNIFIGKAYPKVNPTKLHDLLMQTNKEHEKILELLKSHDALGIRQYLEEVHWNEAYALYDTWK